MNMVRIVVRGGTVALCAAGAVALGAGTASASTPTPDSQAAAISYEPSQLVQRWHYCDDWHHRGAGPCHGDRWNWDDHGHHWDHDRWDGHRGDHR